MARERSIRETLCAILCDQPTACTALDPQSATRLFTIARDEGVHLLIADRLSRMPITSEGLTAVRQQFAAAIQHQSAVDELSRRELESVLTALAHAGIHALVFKGAALGYSHYTDPSLRPRGDADVLVRSGDIGAVREVLEMRGYRQPPFVSGELVMYQVPYIKTDARRIQHALDVHWKIANPQIFADALTAEELFAGAVSISALGQFARAPGPVHALALACIHRAAHHGPAVDDERLIWLYDIHLLAERMTTQEQDAFVDLIDRKQLTTVCADALGLTAHCFRGPAADSLSRRLRSLSTGREEPSALYVKSRLRKLDVLQSDLRALSGWRARMTLLRETVLPPRAYMKRAYGLSSSSLLPFFYAMRLARGAAVWCRRIEKSEKI